MAAGGVGDEKVGDLLVSSGRGSQKIIQPVAVRLNGCFAQGADGGAERGLHAIEQHAPDFATRRPVLGAEDDGAQNRQEGREEDEDLVLKQ